MAQVAKQLRPKPPKLVGFMDKVEADVLAYMTFPAAHRAKLQSANPIVVNGEIERRTEVVAIFSTIQMVGPILLDQNDERAAQRAAT